MSFIEFQNIFARLLVIETSYLLELMSNSIMNHNSRTKSSISKHNAENNFHGRSFNTDLKVIYFRSQ